MRYDGLQSSYWDAQCTRVNSLVGRIRGGDAVASGRVVPEQDDLVIGDGRRLRLAILFLDISGFSSLPAETVAEQELLRRALNLFFSEMIKIAEDYGGTVEKNTGDGLMAYFPDEASEKGAVRAVAAALTMHAANEHLLAPHFRASGLAPFSFRVAIDSGYVTIARLGAARRFNAITAVGTTANIACKLLALADRDGVLVGDAARTDLPLSWQVIWTAPLGVATGWEYRNTGLAYTAWRFTGRWIKLI
jgi:adenylate cyclase